MWIYIIKVIVTAIAVVAISELSKRWTLFGALIASLPLTSLLAMIWLYFDTKDLQKVTSLATGIFWIVIPSLVFFLAFPFFVRLGWGFWSALAGSCLGTAVTYSGYIVLLGKLGVKI
ncbi:MAG: DUF3147 family protein [Bdellovibrionales bacterium]|nr:DUF3147 family protein [Bdellovibrionales bacterium]